MPVPRTFEALGEATRQREQAHLKAVERDEAIEKIKEHEAKVAHDLALMRHSFEPDLPFSPTPKLRAQIISDLLHSVTLEAMADKASTTVEQLALWMEREEIDKSMNAIERAMERKLRFRSLHEADSALDSAASVLLSYNEYESYLPPAVADSKHIANTLRNREGATKAANTILKTIRLTDPKRRGSPRPPSPYTPGMSEGSAQRIPGCSESPQLPTAPDTPAPLSDLKSQIGAPPESPTVHPDAHRFPSSKRRRDPLPDSHPAVLTGAASRSAPGGGGGRQQAAGGGSASSPHSSTSSCGLGSRLPFTPLTMSSRPARPP